MNQYINEYGIINAKPEDIVAENCPLFTQEYLHLIKNGNLSSIKYLPNAVELQQNLNKYVDLCLVKPGLYNNLPFTNTEIEEDKYCSPDQLIAFLANLKDRKDKQKLKDIWNYLKSHWFTYDNINQKTDFSRIMQPQAILLAGVLGGGFLTRLLLRPLLSLAVFISVLPKKGTSGELKSWVMMKAAKMKITEWICNKLIKREYGNWEKVFKIYFPLEDHPIHKIAHYANE